MKKRTCWKTRTGLLFPALILIFGSIISCANPISDWDDEETVDESDIYYSELTAVPDWDSATHEKLGTDEIIANFSTIFDTTTVQKIRIVIEPENWDIMQENLSYLKNKRRHSTDFSSLDDPMFFPSEVFYNGTEWYKVGIRFKGSSSLYYADCSKLPFKLDFDEFEDEYPLIDNQRFYGFKQLNLKNNYEDESEMHEIVAAQLFSDFGLIISHCSFYKLYLNVDGSGDEANDIYYGLYTLVEEVDDTVIKTQYNDDSGNLYKPEDDAATFASGTYDEDEFDLKTDDDETYSDILKLYQAINDSSRTTAPDTWKSNLEEIFDVDIFLKWLAANTVMQNWDTYGVMSHNYYLYNNPETGKFEWLPWDSNEALVDDSKCLSLSMTTVTSSWPLIRYILNDTDYLATYKIHVDDFADTIFNATLMDPIYEAYKVLIQDHVADEDYGYTFTSSSKFTSAVRDLKAHASNRYTAANAYTGID